ncbi:hypothetical protein PSPO01_01669 [Paraphaeosphaeria sporulosa]
MESVQKRSRQMSFLHRLHNRGRRPSDGRETQLPSPSITSPETSPPLPSPSLFGVNGPLSDASIHADFFDLYASIIDHVRNYYSCESIGATASQTDIEPAIVGLSIPWTRIRVLLHKPRYRREILTLCIAWVMLSRCLLLKLGMSNSPGSSFLPPEIVECFQSFSMIQGLKRMDLDGSYQLFRREADLVLLSHWKQISATLLHATYVTNGFSYFDSRTANIERALRDLNPLLAVYSVTSGASDASRLLSLREILRKGARLAFTLFGQPSFWQFDWSQAVPSSSSQYHHEPSKCSDSSGECGFATAVNGEAVGEFLGKRAPSLNRNASDALNTRNLVIWPALVRVVDGEGARVVREDGVLSEKITLETLASRFQDDSFPKGL